MEFKEKQKNSTCNLILQTICHEGDSNEVNIEMSELSLEHSSTINQVNLKEQIWPLLLEEYVLSKAMFINRNHFSLLRVYLVNLIWSNGLEHGL